MTDLSIARNHPPIPGQLLSSGLEVKKNDIRSCIMTTLWIGKLKFYGFYGQPWD